MTRTEKNQIIREFFKSRPALTIRRINLDCGLPNTLLSQVINGYRELNDQQILMLLTHLKKYEFQVEELIREN